MVQSNVWWIGWNSFHNDIENIKSSLTKNAYPPFLIDKFIKRYLHYKFFSNQNQLKDQSDVHYFKLLYIGNLSHHIKVKLSKFCKEFSKENFNLQLVFNSFKDTWSSWVLFKKCPKGVQKLETVPHKLTCSDLTIAQKKWLNISIYQPPTPEELTLLLQILTNCLSKGSQIYKNIVILVDFNISVKVDEGDLDKLEELNLFDSTNLTRYETYFARNHKSSIDLILTDKPKTFWKHLHQIKRSKWLT